MSANTEDFLVEQPAIQLMQHELGWDVGGERNIEHRSEEKRKIRLNPDLQVEAIEGAVEERGILNGRGRRQAVPRLNRNSGEVEG